MPAISTSSGAAAEMAEMLKHDGVGHSLYAKRPETIRKMNSEERLVRVLLTYRNTGNRNIVASYFFKVVRWGDPNAWHVSEERGPMREARVRADQDGRAT
jgi:hypothetical protein